MPIPKPMSDEDHETFMKRCMGEVGDEPNADAMCEAMWKDMHGKAKPKKIKGQMLAISAPVQITAAVETEGQKKGPAAFTATFYTGGAMDINGWDLPVVIDLAGLERGNVLVANLDHDSTKRVGNFDVNNDGKTLVAHGTATAKTAARDEVVGSALEGYQWQASLEVNPRFVEELKAGKTAVVNGQEITGPAYITRKGTLKGFGFVSHGADDNTSVAIAASAASQKGKNMDAAVKAWIKDMGLDIEELSEEQLTKLEANYKGQQPEKTKKKSKVLESLDAIDADAERVEKITDYATSLCAAHKYDTDYRKQIRELAEQAIEGSWAVDKFRLEALEAGIPIKGQITSRRDPKLNDRILEAALCQAGRLQNIDKYFKDEELQLAHDQFRGGIGLNQFLILGAEANGYRARTGGKVTLDVQRAAFGMTGYRQINAQGFSTIDVATIVSNTANKFLREGWNAVDLTPLNISSIRPVSDFKTITTVSLVGDTEFEQVGPDGQIKHGTLDEVTYTNKADTYARMLAITRADIINDDARALTAAPRKLGRGGALKLNNIFWTEFLNNGSFFTSGNANVNTGVADMTVGGLAATEAIFMNQTDPNGDPLGLMPAIILVPTALKAAALTLMNSELLIDGTGTATQGNANIWRGRFRVESSPYMSNSAYTGYSAAAWYMLANPSDLPVIEIAALNGRVEPVVESTDADFNSLGIQMRGYSDVGVNLQEYRGGVRADGGSS